MTSTAAGAARLALAVSLALGVGLGACGEDDAGEDRFCTAEGYEVGGTTLVRDPEQDCAWVDPEGNTVPVDDEGVPVGP